MSLLLGLDVGTTRTKALLLDETGGVRGLSAVDTPFRPVAGGGVEMEVEALREAVAAALSGLGPARDEVAAVGVAGMAEAGAPIDAGGEPLAAVMAWHDPRGAETVERLRAKFGEELERRTGQRLRTVSSVAKMGWLAGSGRLGGVATWLGVPELILFALTHTLATEHSLASRSGCYDVTARAWMPEVAEAAGLPAAALPPVLAAGLSMGRVTDDGAAWSGLRPGIPVTVAGHDHLAGAEGVGAEPGDAFNSVGTAETVLRRTADLPDVGAALALRLAVSVRPGGQGWTVLASAARSGAVLTTAACILGRSPADLDALAAAAEPADLDALAAAAEPADRVDVAALLASLAAGGAVDLPAAPPGGLWAGLLHALAEAAAEAGTRLTGLLGDPPHRLVVYGGGSISRPWMSRKARLAGVPMFRSTSPEAAARGAAVLAGVAGGWWPSADAAPAPVLEPVM